MSALQNKLPLKDFKKIWQVRREGGREGEERVGGRAKGRQRENQRERERGREEREMKCSNSTGS